MTLTTVEDTDYIALDPDQQLPPAIHRLLPFVVRESTAAAAANDIYLHQVLHKHPSGMTFICSFFQQVLYTTLNIASVQPRCCS